MLQKKPNKAVERTKSWIFEALLNLLDQKPYAEIGIADITEKAGVARSSFYRNYASKEDIIIQGIDAIFDKVIFKLWESEKKETVSPLLIYFETLLEHRDIMEKLVKNNILYFLEPLSKKHETFILDTYKETLPSDKDLRFQFAVKFQLGGLAHIVLSWLQNGCPLPPEEMSVLVDNFLSPFKDKNQSIIDLLLMIKK